MVTYTGDPFGTPLPLLVSLAGVCLRKAVSKQAGKHSVRTAGPEILATRLFEYHQ